MLEKRSHGLHVLLAGLLLAGGVASGCSESSSPAAPSQTDTTRVAAKPPGDARDNDVGKMLYKFNVIATPKSDWVVPDGECTNQGHRIFFQRGNGNTLGEIRWHLEPGLNPSFQIQDCDGTNDAEADVWANESRRFYVMVRLLGPKNSSLTLTCQEVIEEGADDLCLVDTVNLSRNSTTKIMENVVDNAYEEVLWSLSGDWRIFEVRIYEKL